MLPRHLVSGRNDSAPVLIERLELALLSMSDDDQARKIMLKIDKSTKFDPLPGGGSKDHNSRAVASYLFCGE